MPLKRTPPGSPACTQMSDTEPSVKVTAPASGSSNTTSRTKKKKESSSNDDFKTFVIDMKKMFEDFKMRQEQSFSSLESTVKELSQQLTGFRATIDFMSKQYDTVIEKIGCLETERKNNIAIIQNLEEKLESAEKYQRSTSIEIRNIPHDKSENKDTLSEIIMRTSKVINLPVKSTDLKDIFRTNTKSANKPIIVDFTTVLFKEKFLQAVAAYNKTYKTNKLNTNSIRIEGSAKPVYISENLTYKTRKLFYTAREFAKSNNYKYCWCAHGKIYLRQSDGSTLIRVNSEQDLTKLTAES